MAILPSDEAAALISHYLRQLAERAGVRWTEANDRDMARLADLLDQVAPADDPDTIPPYRPAPQIETRVTQQLDTLDDPHFHRWRAARYVGR